MRKKEKIEAILETMEEWDVKTLMGFAQDVRRELLKKCSAKQINEVYEIEVEGTR